MPKGRVTRQAVGAAVGAVAAVLTLVSWAVSSPPGSAPDEPYQLASTFCGQGLDDLCRSSPKGDLERMLPPEVTTLACYAREQTVSGLCKPPGYGDDLEPSQSNPVGNWNDKKNPPVYYAVMATFVGHNLDATVLRIRIVNGLLAVLLVGGLALLLPARLRRIPTTAYLVASVPLALFIGTSVNPSAWTVASIGPLWLATYAAFEATGTRQRLLWAFMVVSALVAAGARADGSLFSVLAIGLALGMRLPELRRAWQTTVVAAVAVALVGVLFAASGHSSAVSEGLTGYEPVPAKGLALLVGNALNVPYLWTSSLGMGRLSLLGWFDTPMPFIVGFLSVLTCGFVMITGWASTWWQKTTAIGVTIAALAVYPLVLLQESKIFTGMGVQPRYMLPLLIMLVAISLLPREGSPPPWGRLQVVALVAALSLAQSVALYSNLVRYVEGVPVDDHIGFLGDGWWWQDLPGNGYLPWVVGSLSFAVLSAVVLAQWWPATRRTAMAAESVPQPSP